MLKKEDLQNQIRTVNEHLIILYEKVNVLYEVINGMNIDEYDMENPYHKKIKKLIYSYSDTIKLQQENKQVFEEMLKEMEN